jgi:hypothetical protein
MADTTIFLEQLKALEEAKALPSIYYGEEKKRLQSTAIR